MKANTKFGRTQCTYTLKHAHRQHMLPLLLFCSLLLDNCQIQVSKHREETCFYKASKSGLEVQTQWRVPVCIPNLGMFSTLNSWNFGRSFIKTQSFFLLEKVFCFFIFFFLKFFLQLTFFLLLWGSFLFLFLLRLFAINLQQANLSNVTNTQNVIKSLNFSFCFLSSMWLWLSVWLKTTIF